jgi:hypothetical protein
MVRPSDPDRDPAATTTRRVESCDDPALLDAIGERVAELRTQLAELWAIKVAEIKLGIWEKAVGLAAALLGFLLVAAILVTGVFFVLAGIAGGLSESVSSPWLGQLLAGIAAVVVVAAGFLVARRILVAKAAKGGQGRKSE